MISERSRPVIRRTAASLFFPGGIRWQTLMKIWKRLPDDHIFLGADIDTKDAVLRRAASILTGLCQWTGPDGALPSASQPTSRPTSQPTSYDAEEAIYAALWKREVSMSTGIGCGIALPHAALPDVAAPAACLLRPSRPLEFDALDHRPVDLIISMVFPSGEVAFHLRFLAGLSRLCKNQDLLDAMRTAETPAKVHAAIRELEERMPFH